MDKVNHVSEEKESFLEWFNDVIPETQFPQIAAQVLFECMNCSECCRGEGYTLVDHEDMQEIARSFEVSVGRGRSQIHGSRSGREDWIQGPEEHRHGEELLLSGYRDAQVQGLRKPASHMQDIPHAESRPGMR